MTRTLYGRLFSTKTLVRVGFAVLSLHATGAAFAQGLSAGATAPMYGTPWAAARAQSHNLNAQNVTSEPSKAARAEASMSDERSARLSSHRTGG